MSQVPEGFIPDSKVPDGFIPDPVPAENTRVGRAPASNRNREWRRALAHDIPLAGVNGIPYVLGGLGGDAGIAYALATGRWTPTQLAAARSAGAYAGGFTGETGAAPLRTLLGEPVPPLDPVSAFSRANRAGMEQAVYGALEAGAAPALDAVARWFNTVGIGVTSGMKRELGKDIARRVTEARATAVPVFGRGGLPKAESARSAAAQKTNALLSEAGQEAHLGAHGPSELTITGNAPPWSTVGSGQNIKPDYAAIWRATHGPHMATQISPGHGVMFNARELRSAFDEVIATLKKGPSWREQVRRVEQMYQKFLRDHPDGISPTELKQMKQYLWDRGKPILDSEKRDAGKVTSDRLFQAQVDVAMARHANTMLDRIPGVSDAEAVTQNAINVARAINSAERRRWSLLVAPTAVGSVAASLPGSTMDRTKHGLEAAAITSAITHPAVATRMAWALTSPAVRELLAASPRFAGYLLTQGMKEYPAEDDTGGVSGE